MPLMSTCLGRLGSRYSLIVDPIRRRIAYGALGLMCQREDAGLRVAITDGVTAWTLPLCPGGTDFFCVDQRISMTAVRFEGRCLELGIALEFTLTAPFYPRDERTSLVPAYLLEAVVRPIGMTRWEFPPKDAARAGELAIELILPDAERRTAPDGIHYRYPVQACDVFATGEGGDRRTYRDARRKTPLTGTAADVLMPLSRGLTPSDHGLRASFDVRHRRRQTFRAALVSHCADALFERFGNPLPLKYTHYWPDLEAVRRFVRRDSARLLARSRAFDALFEEGAYAPAARNLTALGFQSYLMCTLWAYGPMTDRAGAPLPQKDWFSVWEGSCWFNSTVDVTYNEALFYFACWPELLEFLFDEWRHHANTFEGEKRRRAFVSDDDKHGNPLTPFPGAVMEHDMGAGWSCNGQSYHHAMPVEENANFLLLLYAHGKWWGRETLFATHGDCCAQLAEYLLWADGSGNGFPDRGTANTIDDANPAVQYGRDNVYLGIKRLAALHAAARMLNATGNRALAHRCAAAVRRAVRTLQAGWLGDHYPVALDKTTTGLLDSWTKKPLRYKTLPGWDGYSLYTTNGLLYLMMIDDLPAGLIPERLRTDLHGALAHAMTPYGCSHSSFDPERVWISMNIWRDCVAAYMGDDLRLMAERYWEQQLFGNGPGAEKANAFVETSLANNLVWYPRGAAAFGFTFAFAGLRGGPGAATPSVAPVAPGTWPLLPLADWRSGTVPVAVTRRHNGRLDTRIENRSLFPG